MVSPKNAEVIDEQKGPSPVVLSEGAGIALGSVFSRLIKPRASEQLGTSGRKRPRSEKAPVVLIESEEVQESLAEEKEERRKYKEAKKAKLKFETNALVIPDAATGATLEKQLLMTATKGAVALFNAVSKAQKVVEQKPAGKKKKGPPISRESFMDIMRAGINKEVPSKPETNKLENESSDEEDKVVKPGAKWLKEDYLTAGSKKLKDWDKDAPENEDSSSEDSDSGTGESSSGS